MSEKTRRGSAATNVSSRKRKHRARPVPTWLQEQQDLDAIARARCLLVLRVLSGETPVTDAIAEAKISRGMYYQLETRALRAMLAALAPGASEDVTRAGEGSTRRIAELEEKTRRLEQEKRRTERLLFLTRKVVSPSTVKTKAGRPAKVRSSTATGSTGSKAPSAQGSIHRPAGAGAPSGGNAS